MANSKDDAAWGNFWAQTANRSTTTHNGGCLPQRWAEIEKAQQKCWLEFIKDLEGRAKLLDLATGDGRVLRWMIGARDDLDLIGIDLAPQLPLPPKGTETRGGVSMEDLPFDDNTFIAVVSQFGFEYGDVTKVASEIARVLAPAGRVGLMVHRGDGPILEHNLARREQLLWALKEKAVARRAKVALKAKFGGIDRAAKAAADIAAEGAQRFGQESPAWEIPEAIRRSVLMGQRAGIASITDTIGAIDDQAKNELGRINSLARACATADARDVIIAAFESHGLALQATQTIAEPSGRELADFITFA
ncbi:MAG: class I SAM-dependent methyltransferase [Pseudomonadota bacterium]